MEPEAVEIRPARRADGPGVAAVVAAGFETYREFAPRAWEPPPPPPNLADLLVDPRRWAHVAEAGGRIVASCAFAPGTDGPLGPEIPGLAHVWNLFVAEPWWGTGVASSLLGLAVDAMGERGYREGRLFAAAGQARARRFYAREGWREVRGPFDEPHLGLPLVELRRRL